MPSLKKSGSGSTGQEKNHTSNIKVALALNSIFVILEIVGGILTNSMAILSDALHDLGDSLSLGMAWYFQKLSGRRKDKTFSFGYKRFSLLGAVINSMVLLVGSTFILNETIPRLFNPQSPDVRGMFFLALLGIAVNGMAALRLRKGKSINEKVVSLHLWEDVLSWGAILIGSVVMLFSDLPVIDPILSVAITLFILFNVFRNLKKSFRVFLQGVPTDTDIEDIEKQVLSLPGVDSIHDMHIWSMDGQYNILTLHLVSKEIQDYKKIRNLKTQIKHFLKNLKIDHITIEVDSPEDECPLDSCQ
jgi:cobalt-zinc-cadmium efflux system protein